MTFPRPGDEIFYNEAGEPLGWDTPAEPWYCDECGCTHSPSRLTCPFDDVDEA